MTESAIRPGRKEWLPSPEDLQRAEQMASRGLSLTSIAGGLGISTSTFFDKMRKYPELSKCIKRGAASAVEEVANKLFETALAGNVTAMIFFLKSRAGWKECVEVDLEPPPESLLDLSLLYR
jgi:hypothetical protein